MTASFPRRGARSSLARAVTLLLLIAVTGSALPLSAAIGTGAQDTPTQSFGTVHPGPATMTPNAKLRLGAKPAPRVTTDHAAFTPDSSSLASATESPAASLGSPARRRAVLRVYRF